MVPVPQRASPAHPPHPSVVKLPPTGSHMLHPGDPESQPRGGGATPDTHSPASGDVAREWEGSGDTRGAAYPGRSTPVHPSSQSLGIVNRCWARQSLRQQTAHRYSSCARGLLHVDSCTSTCVHVHVPHGSPRQTVTQVLFLSHACCAAHLSLAFGCACALIYHVTSSEPLA